MMDKITKLTWRRGETVDSAEEEKTEEERGD